MKERIVGNERLRAQRQLRGWSQEDVVRGLVDVGIEIGERQLGVTRSLISRWERGVTSPRAPYPKLLCLLFKATAEELGLVSSSPPPPAYFTIEESTVGDENVERRELLDLLYRAARTTPVWAMLPHGFRSQGEVAQPTLVETGALEVIITITGSYRRLDDNTPSPELLPLALGHFHHVSGMLRRSMSQADRTRVAAVASEAAGLAGSVAFDTGDHEQAAIQYRAAITFAEQAGNNLLQAFSLGMMGCFKAETGRRTEAVSLVEQGRSLLPRDVPATVQARMATYEANTYARVGDRSQTLAALARADTASERIGHDEEMFWPLVFPFDSGRLERERGACATRLELSEIALPALKTGLAALGSVPTCYGKRRALVLCDLAESYIRTGEIDEACRHAAEAFAIGLKMGSDRILQQIGSIGNKLTPWKDTQAVKELEEKLVGGLLRGLIPDRYKV
ncbi:MAG: helix-turn-helix transcriptional regulator [Actinomycetota bacterium]